MATAQNPVIQIKIGVDSTRVKPDLAKVQAQLTKLGKGIETGGSTTMAAGFASANKEAIRLQQTLAGQVKQLRTNRTQMAGLGSSTDDLAKKQVALRKDIQQTQTALGGLSLTKLGIAGGLVALGYYANQVRKIADEYTNLNSRLKLVTEGEDELAKVRERLYMISQETGTEYAGNADSYTKLARAVKDLGGTSEDTLQITELVNKSLIINGSTTSMASAFMLQFAQAMGSGVLQGDEFRSMLENNGYFAAELAKTLDTNIAGLREMSKNGELTAQVLRQAFPQMAKNITAEFGKIAPTVERALTMLGNSFKRIVDESNRASGGTESIAQSVMDLAQTIDQHRDGIIALFTRMINLAAKTVGALGNIGQSFAGWDAVFDGDLSFFEFATMNAQELDQWLKKNVKSYEATGKAAQKAGDTAAAAGRKSAETQEKETAKALESMAKKYQKYAAEVIRLNNEIFSEQENLEAELREMSRTGMSDYSAWKDRKQEAQEYAAAARQAMEDGNDLLKAGDQAGSQAAFANALEYARQAKSAYGDLNKEVKQGETVAVSQKEALQVSMEGVRTSGQLVVSILQQQEKAAAQVLDNLSKKASFDDLTKGMDEVEKQWIEKWASMRVAAGKSIAGVQQQIGEMPAKLAELKTAFADVFKPPEDGDWGAVWTAMESGSKQSATVVNTQWNQVWDHWLASGSDDVEALNKKLSELIKDRHMKVYVQTVEAKSTGGMIGGYHLGGSIQALATGGGVRNIIPGGWLPGFGGGDTVPLWGEAGEYMINKWSSLKAGLPALQYLNAGNIEAAIAELSKRLRTRSAYRLGGVVQSLTHKSQHLATGGQVAPASAGAGSGGDSMTIYFDTGRGEPIPVTTTRANARALKKEFDRAAWRASR